MVIYCLLVIRVEAKLQYRVVFYFWVNVVEPLMGQHEISSCRGLPELMKAEQLKSFCLSPGECRLGQVLNIYFSF